MNNFYPRDEMSKCNSLTPSAVSFVKDRAADDVKLK
jgi:hypothetical protein